MSWLMRLFKKASDGLKVTLQPEVTSGLEGANFRSGTVSTVTQTVASPYIQINDGPRIYTWASMLTANVPIPHAIGDIGICTGTGKLYVAGAATASTDWKLVTSA